LVSKPGALRRGAFAFVRGRIQRQKHRPSRSFRRIEAPVTGGRRAATWSAGCALLPSFLLVSIKHVANSSSFRLGKYADVNAVVHRATANTPNIANRQNPEHRNLRLTGVTVEMSKPGKE
jgi:hypothetical protein